MTCQVDGCTKPTRTRGYCGAHYTRFWRTGALVTTQNTSRRRATTPDTTMRDLVLSRDGNGCVVCGQNINRLGIGWEPLMRKSLSSGGKITAANLVTVCGTAYAGTGCHGEISCDRSAARRRGLLLWRSDNPENVPAMVTLRPGNAVTPALTVRFHLHETGRRTETKEQQ